MVYRVENKYLISYFDYIKLNSRISGVLKRDSNCKNDKTRYKISSLYFDTLNDELLYDTISGNPIRSKYRIRIYNDDLGVIKMEVKENRYGRIYKKSELIDQDTLKNLLHGQYGNEQSCCNVYEEYKEMYYQKLLVPRVIITYEREAYLCEIGNVRITFDFNIMASKDIQSLGRLTEYDWYNGEEIVLEVKYDTVIPDYILELLELNYLRQISNSKYRICREALM